MRRGPSRKAWVPPLFGASGAARFNLIGNIQPVREDSTRSEEVESSRSGATPHRQQACARVSSLTLHMPASTRPRPGSNAPDPSHYTRSVALHPIRRGAMPTDRVFRLPKQVQPRAFTPDTPKRQHQTLPDNLEIPARLRTRGAAPVTSRYTRYVAIHPIRRGAMPTDRVHRFIDNKRDRGELCPAPATPASNRTRSRSIALDTAAMH